MKTQIVLALILALLFTLALGNVQNDKITVTLKDIKDPKEIHQEKMKAVLDELKKTHGNKIENKEEVTITSPSPSTLALAQPEAKTPPASEETIPVQNVKVEPLRQVMVTANPFGWIFGDHESDPFASLFTQTIEPKVNIFVTEGEDILLLELPGVKKEDIKIELKKDRKEILTVTGKRNRMESPGTLLREDIDYGSFEKSFIVQRTSGKINASLKDGILKIVVGKKPIERQTVDVTIE